MCKSQLVRLVAISLAATMALGACAQEEETSGTGGGTKTQAAGETSPEACNANLAVEKGFNKVFSEGGPEEGPPNPEQIKKIQEAVDREVLPHAETVEENAPEEIKDEVKTAVASVRKFRADPANYDFEQDKQAHDAIAALDKHFYENCDFSKGQVEAVDYNFKSVPSFSSGDDMVVKFDNQGKEMHEFIVLGKKQGVTDSWDTILQLDEEQGRAKTEFLGAVFAAPGEQDYGLFSFEEPGDYIAVCFIPQGTTSPEQLGGPDGGEEDPSGPGATSSPGGTAAPSPSATAGGGDQGGEEEGRKTPPHFTLGMRKQIKVS